MHIFYAELYDVCELLNGDFESLKSGLTARTVDVRHDVLVTDLNAREACYSRDALCRAIYGRLFTWIVARINDVLRVRRPWVLPWRRVCRYSVQTFLLFPPRQCPVCHTPHAFVIETW